MTGNQDEGLFRTEAIAHRGADAHGHPRLLSPPGAGLICLLLLISAMVAVLFASSNSYSRKATVAGYLETREAIKRVYPARPGVVSEIVVQPGETVSQGDTLVTFRAILPVNAGARADALAEYEQQLAAIADRIRASHAEAEAQRSSIEADVKRSASAIEDHEAILSLQHMKVAQLNETHDAARPLYETGHLSRIEWGRFRESLLNAQQQEARLRADIAAMRQDHARLQISLDRLASSTSANNARLAQEASRIRQSRYSASGEANHEVTAPIGGLVSNLFVQEGDQVNAQDAIVSIQPPHAPLTARLLIPSRAVGFVRPGMTVHVLYDAFPHQQFGAFEAELQSISPHALLPKEAPQNLVIREPFFKAQARLKTTAVRAYGEHIPLRSGMTLKADVVLEQRTLVDWLLEPLLVMRGRTS